MSFLPKEILNLIYEYKHEYDMLEIKKELVNNKKKCENCKKNKICLYQCNDCDIHICYECRYYDLNNNHVDYNTFDLFYECDTCSLNKLCFDKNDYCLSEEEYYYYNYNSF